VWHVRGRLLGRRPVAALPPAADDRELAQVPNGRSW